MKMKDLQARNEKLAAALHAAQMQLISVRAMLQTYGHEDVARLHPATLSERMQQEEKQVAIAIDNISRA